MKSFVSGLRLHEAMLLVAVSACVSAAQADEVLLQYFEGRWETIERRMPDVFMAGYDGIWVPPPGKADTGGFSVGYDVYDRFDLGTPYSPTLYGTGESFLQLSSEMDRAGIDLYIDAILNHNGFRDSSTPGFESNGGYPGFVTTIPEDIDGDFHGIFEGGDLNERLAGLIDIAQEKNHLYVRHPVPGFSDLIPNETPREENRQFYPDLDLPEDYGRHPFNTLAPEYGDPVVENGTGLLLRYIQWMVEVNGVDGFRLDATKHIPTFFFNDFYDAAAYNLGRNPIDDSPRTPFSFGENYTGDFGALSAYVRKDGFGNRDTLDFPLFFAMDGVFGAGGFGDMRNLEFASYDGSDGSANDGSRGVMFAGSHDSFAAGEFSGLGNLSHAHILTRTGLPLVYYNAQEFGDGRDFPKGGRGDALGNYTALITTLLRINDQYIRGGHATRWIDEDLYIYERTANALIGINDRKDGGYDGRLVQTAFAPGTVLVELTGNATSALVDPVDDIPDELTVDANGRVNIHVPRNTSSEGDFHGRGYVVYGPKLPPSSLTITNSTETIGPDPDDGRPQGARRLTELEVVTSDTIDVQLEVSASAETPSDQSLIKVNFGELDVDGDGNRNPGGTFAGFEEFPEDGQPIAGSEETRVYTASLAATGLAEGYTYIESVSFLQRPENSSPLFDVQRKVVYLDRLPPEQDLLFPPQTGEDDVLTRDYEAVVQTDHTADSVHILVNVPAGASDGDILGLISGTTQARRHDRKEYRKVLSNLTPGLNELTVVAFEETGNYSVERYGNIDVDVTFPLIELGIDSNQSATGVTFVSLPESVDTASLAEDVVIRVQTEDIDGEGRNISFPGDFAVSLQVDDGEALLAQPYDPGLLPPVGRLVQNDQNLSDEFDEFRIQWRGYTKGSHSFRAQVLLLDNSEPPNEALGTVFVADSTSGPLVTITFPEPPGEAIDDPDVISVEGVFEDDLAAFAQVYIDIESASALLGTIENPAPGTFRVEKPVDSFARNDRLEPGALALDGREYTVRVVAMTGVSGTGISSETSSVVEVTGVPILPRLPELRIDGNAEDLLVGPVLAVSAADGAGENPSPADFGADGTLTELRALFRDQDLYVTVRGDMFGEDEGDMNASFLLMDVDGGSDTGSDDLLVELQDFSDGLRGQISSVPASLAAGLEGSYGIDAVVGITAPEVGFGYTLGSGGLGGSFDEFEYQPGINVAYDFDSSAPAGAPGTTIAGPNAFEIRIPTTLLSATSPETIRFAAMTTSDDGYASPNTLPENASDAFGASPNAQVIEELAAFPLTGMVLINEVFTGSVDIVELYNPSGETVTLDDWALRFTDSAGADCDYVFPSGVSLQPGQYLLLSDRGGAVPPTSSLEDLYTGFNIPWDQSRGGSAALIDPAGIGKDFVAWRNIDDSPLTDTGTIPFGTDYTDTVAGAESRSAGHSLARDASSTDTNSAGDWEATSGIDSDGPTFGGVNSGGVTGDKDRWLIH